MVVLTAMRPNRDGDTKSVRPDSRIQFASIVVAILGAIVVAAYAGLLQEGRWQEDEYYLISNIQRWGWRILPTRLLYSPRPFSEMLLFTYGRAVLTWHRPLITVFLASLWLGLLGSIFLAIRFTTRAENRNLVAFTVAVVLAAHWLTTNLVTEMFYWPMAAAAYLPLLAAAAAMCFLVGQTGRRRELLCCVALLVAALTSEIGAFLTIEFAACATLIVAGNGLDRKKPHARWRALTWWLVPSLCGIGVLVALFAYRASVKEPIAMGAPYAGHFYASIDASFAELVREAVGDWLVLATRICLAAGTGGLLRFAGVRSDVLWPVALAAALLGAAYFNLVAAYDHYGRLCCERHQALRGCLLDLVFIALALALCGRIVITSARRTAFGSLVLLFLSLTPALARMHELSKSYAILGWAIESRDRTWTSGTRPGETGMVFYQPPDTPGEAVKGTGITPNLYQASVSPPGLISAIAYFFGKKRVRVCQAWQTTRSWIIHGVVIPACPDP